MLKQKKVAVDVEVELAPTCEWAGTRAARSVEGVEQFRPYGILTDSNNRRGCHGAAKRMLDHTEEGEDVQLVALLVASEAFDEDVGKLLSKCEARDKRGLIASALCTAAFEHGLSQRILLGAGLTGTALSLCRLHFEAVVRATWTAECAYGEWLDKFTAPVEGLGHVEPANPVSIGAMIKHISAKVKHVDEEYALLNTTIPAMHSFVHSGAQAVAHALMPSYPIYTMMGALWNRNLLHLYTANAAVKAAENGLLMPRLRLLQEKHAECMPPTRKIMPTEGGPEKSGLERV